MPNRLWGGTIWANSALMNLWIVCHEGYRHASMQEDVLLGIRGTGVYCNLDHNFWKSICMMVHHAICGFHEQWKVLTCCLCWSLIPFVCKGSGTCGTEAMKNFFLCVYISLSKIRCLFFVIYDPSNYSLVTSHIPMLGSILSLNFCFGFTILLSRQYAI